MLPGLVQGEYMEEKEATLTYTAFIEEKKNRTFDAHQFMQRRFKQLHMESYIQKFTINIPFMDGRVSVVYVVLFSLSSSIKISLSNFKFFRILLELFFHR